MLAIDDKVNKIRVVLADDHLLVREGVQRLLELEEDIAVVASVADLISLVTAIGELHPDVVVTDIRMPPENADEGIRIARELRETSPDVGVVVLSQYANPAYALALLDHGSRGRAYLIKEHVSEPGHLVAAIREVAAGGSVIDPRVVEALVKGRTQARTSPLAWLTIREREVLSEMAQGKNNEAIGHVLGLGERAVEKHIGSILSKLGLSQEQDVNRRVKAVLLYLADQSG